MLISINWIKDFVNIPSDISYQQLAERFTLQTAEVEQVTLLGGYLEDTSVAEITDIRPHPQADKLNLVSFKTAQGIKEVVCGAPNVKKGLKVPYAPLGTVLPGGLKLEAKKIRGVLSEGMLCSEVELDLGEGKAGLMQLDSKAEVGQSLKDYLGAVSDVLLDVDNKSLTHRPDLWGHYAMAREFAVALNLEMDQPYGQKWQENLEKLFNELTIPITPRVDKDSSCLGYYALSIDGVKVEQSPLWMQQRLKAVGLRPINNIVDISNYVMLELGFPLHIFDRDKIEGEKLFITKLKQDTHFTTLDEIERQLLASDTVIADKEKNLVLAGIMGGANSGVDQTTTRILIEVANWKANEVRKTSTRLGLRTDSSQRYEKSLDTNLCYRTLLRALELLIELCPQAKVIGKPCYDGQDLTKTRLLSLSTSAKKISKVLGKDIEQKKIIDIFHSLDFSVQSQGDEISVTVPTYRTTKDIECEADLIEEVGRVIGYDNIAANAPRVDIGAVRLSYAKQLHRKIQDFLVMQAKALEIFTYPLVGEKMLQKAQWPEDNQKLVLVNALSVEHSRMRPSLIPSMLESSATNAKYYSDFSCFELGRVYREDDNNFSQERSQLILALYSRRHNRFVELINHTQNLLHSLNIPFQLQRQRGRFTSLVLPEDWHGNHPHEQLHLQIMGKFSGAINTVHPLLLRQYKIKGHLSFALIDLTDVELRQLKDKTRYQAISKFPRSTFDCSVVALHNVYAADILIPLRKLKIKQLVDCRIAGVYHLDEKQKSVTIRVFFEDREQTLKPDFLKNAEHQVVQALEKAGYPLKS